MGKFTGSSPSWETMVPRRPRGRQKQLLPALGILGGHLEPGRGAGAKGSHGEPQGHCEESLWEGGLVRQVGAGLTPVLASPCPLQGTHPH